MKLQVEGAERVLGDNDLIVSKTDLRGYITYANDVFLDVAEYSLAELLNKPHSMVRSKGMPRAAFKLMWDRLAEGREFFAYVVNRTRNNNHYWVFAHITPSFDAEGKITSYHSNRRKPDARAVAEISKVYDAVLAEESRHKNGKQSLAAGYALLTKLIDNTGMDYDEFVLSL